jgi:hypothetical protein
VRLSRGCLFRDGLEFVRKPIETKYPPNNPVPTPLRMSYVLLVLGVFTLAASSALYVLGFRFRAPLVVVRAHATRSKSTAKVSTWCVLMGMISWRAIRTSRMFGANENMCVPNPSVFILQNP